jgi:hypothetical protein
MFNDRDAEKFLDATVYKALFQNDCMVGGLVILIFFG